MREKQRTDEELQETIENLDDRIARLFRHHLDHELFINLLRKDICELETARANHDERLTEHHKRLGAHQRFVNELPAIHDDQLTSLAGRVDELERRMAVMHRDVYGLKQASGPEALPITLDRLAKCEKQIARLQEILEAVARVLPAEYA